MDPQGVMMARIFMMMTILTMVLDQALEIMDLQDQAGVDHHNGEDHVVDEEGVADFVVDPLPASCAGVQEVISDLHLV